MMAEALPRWQPITALDDNDVVAPKRTVDAAAISFSVETMIKVVVFSLGIGGTMWGTTAGMRSDVRDILTQMKSESEKRSLQAQLVDERMETLRETVNDLKRRTELAQYEVGALKEVLMKMGADVKR
jgi:hypothetical protein